MNLRNVALLIFLIAFSFQSETSSFTSNDDYEQMEKKHTNEISNNNDVLNFVISLVVISNYIILFFNFHYFSPMLICLYNIKFKNNFIRK